jgi:predicted GNAT family acetyltransferase
LHCVMGWSNRVNVRRFEDVQAFVERVEPFLMQDEAAHNLILGLCSTLLLTDTYPIPPYLGCCEVDGEIVGVALRTPPYNFILSKLKDDGAVEAFALDAHALYGELPGVIGLKGIASVFADYWQKLTGKVARLSVAERSFRLEKVIPVLGVSGAYCPATPADFDLLVEWWMAFASEAMEAVPREEAEKAVHMRLESVPQIRGLRIWSNDGKPVSMAGYGGPTPNGIRIGPVYTPPEQRQHGYASALTAALSQELLDRGKRFVSLFTDLSNPTSNHIYQTIGYQPVCDVDVFRFES